MLGIGGGLLLMCIKYGGHWLTHAEFIMKKESAVQSFNPFLVTTVGSALPTPQRHVHQ